jgi:hypothetical protein
VRRLLECVEEMRLRFHNPTCGGPSRTRSYSPSYILCLQRSFLTRKCDLRMCPVPLYNKAARSRIGEQIKQYALPSLVNKCSSTLSLVK